MQDDALIRRAAQKDERAFEQLMLLHQKAVYNICYRMASRSCARTGRKRLNAPCTRQGWQASPVWR